MRFDPAKVPTRLDRSAMDGATAAVVAEKHTTAGVLLGADVLPGRKIGVDGHVGGEPSGCRSVGKKQAAQLISVGEDPVALTQVDIGAVLAARVESGLVTGDFAALVAHAISHELTGEDVGIDEAKARMI